MVSEASWHSGIGRYGNAPSGAAPMDQQTVESLLRRLVQRVEESERRYSEALDELHARLDQLAQTTDAARAAGSPDDSATFDRLHDRGEQSHPAARRRRLEPARRFRAPRPGAVRRSELRREPGRRSTPRPAGSAAPPSPRCRASTPPGACPLTSPCRMWIIPPGADAAFPVSDSELELRLAEMAHRLENSSARRCRRRSMP